MKRLFTFVITMLLGASLVFAQTGGGTIGDKAGKTTSDTGKKGRTHTKKGHKGGKKGKKGSSTTTTQPPK